VESKDSRRVDILKDQRQCWWFGKSGEVQDYGRDEDESNGLQHEKWETMTLGDMCYALAQKSKKDDILDRRMGNSFHLWWSNPSLGYMFRAVWGSIGLGISRGEQYFFAVTCEALCQKFQDDNYLDALNLILCERSKSGWRRSTVRRNQWNSLSELCLGWKSQRIQKGCP